MPVERIPGERMYIDWVGDQPELLTNPATGEILKVHVFATTLGFSSCVYAEVFMDEKTPSFIAGVVHALEFYQAVPKYIVPDNLRTAISKNTKDIPTGTLDGITRESIDKSLVKASGEYGEELKSGIDLSV